MNIDADSQVQAALEQLQRALATSNQQKALDIQMWQKKVEEYKSQVDRFQAIISESDGKIRKLQEENENLKVENERLKSENETLNNMLHNKEQELSRFVNLNQSLRSLLDGTPLPSPTSLPQTSYDAHPVSVERTRQPKKQVQSVPEPIQTTIPQSTSPELLSPVPKPTPRTRAPSKSSLFIKAAKEELTHGDFNQMISEINMYNKKTQTRDETIANVRRLLCPSHKALFDQFLPMISGI